jgi:rSAM/selenodomain-associated transferase 1
MSSVAGRSSNAARRPGGVRIVIFAKAPLPGQVKTRLIPSLGAQGAADLARRMLTHTLAQAVAAAVGPVEFCVSPSPQDPAWESMGVPAVARWSDQGDGDLGTRMARAAQRTLAAGEAVLLIGTDCPALDAGHLRHAATVLQQVDATIIPTSDGGYVLLGLNRFHCRLFEGIEWSTPGVARETRRRLVELGWGVQEAAPLHDIDEPADLRWLPSDWLGADKRMEQQAK